METGIVARTAFERNESSFRNAVHGTFSMAEGEWTGTLGYTLGSFACGSQIGEPIWLSTIAQRLFAANYHWETN